jgi:hypothetical protein
MGLDEEIQQKGKEISTDAYAMSIGELISLYKSGELDIHPAFQRYFRWTEEQKSRFIESLLLGIPIPSIFVSQREKGQWDVVDGLQRLSTIFQLTGDLKDSNGEIVKPLVLSKTKYLPSMAGKRWTESAPNAGDELSEATKLILKRARIDLKIVLNKSDESSKYELFQRLNTGGSLATEQEVRNCILIMLNRPFFDWFSELGKFRPFRNCIPLSERQIDEQFDLELIVRFLVLKDLRVSELAGRNDLGTILTDKINSFAESKTYNLENEAAAFKKTFTLIDRALGEDAFKKYNAKKDRATGPLLISLFEVFALGLGHYSSSTTFAIGSEKLRSIQKNIWKNKAFLNGSGSGVGPINRLPVTLELGRKIFMP